MNRRQALTKGLSVAAMAVCASSRTARAGGSAGAAPLNGPTTLYLNASSGSDTNAGTKDRPLRSLAEAAARVNASSGAGAVTVVLAEGVYAVGQTTLLKAEQRSFTRTERLTIRAEVLPDDPDWHIGRMPTLIHSLPLSDTWNGRTDKLGGAANGMLIETSHVSVQGLRILGLPMVETPQAGVIHRLYAISRLQKGLDDLEIAQCLFTGDGTTPLHVGIIANGDGVIVRNCIFIGMKISAVFWTPGSRGHAMHHCICDGLYGSAVWTAGISSDFSYTNNIVTECNYVWTAQAGASALSDAAAAAGAGGAQRAVPVASPEEPPHYKVRDSLFGNNRRLSGSGTGAKLEYQDIPPTFLEMLHTRVIDQAIALERDSTKRGYLHPAAGSEAAGIGAGLFTKPDA